MTSCCTSKRALALTLAFVMAAQPFALAQNAPQPSQPAPVNQAPDEPDDPADGGGALDAVKVFAVIGGIGAGLGLLGYAGHKKYSSDTPWSWQGATLAAAAGVGGLIGGYLLGAFSTGFALDKAGVGESGFIAVVAVGGLAALAGGILSGLYAGKGGDRIAEKRRAKKNRGSSAGPGGLSGALGGSSGNP